MIFLCILNGALCVFIGLPAVLIGVVYEYLHAGFTMGRERAKELIEGPYHG